MNTASTETPKVIPADPPPAPADRKPTPSGQAVGVFVPMNCLHPSKTNVRSAPSKDGLKEMADSMRTHGVLEPLLVRPLKITFGDPQYEIVAGHRRFDGAKIAKLTECPVIIRNMTDQEAKEIQIIENVQREGVHPLDEGLGYKALLALDEQQTAAGIGKKLGKSESYVWKRMKLAELIPAAQAAFRENRIHAGHAEPIARLQPAGQLQALDFLLTRNQRTAATKDERKKGEASASTRELHRYVSEHILLDLSHAVFPMADGLLVKAAGSCNTCPKRAGNMLPGVAEDLRPNSCTDSACYEKKQDAWFREKLAELGKGARLLSVHHMVEKYYSGTTPAGTIGSDKWKPASKPECAATVSGIIVDGGYCEHSSGKIERGKELRVCLNTKCAAHWKSSAAGSGYSKSPDQKAQERKAKALSQAWGDVARQTVAKAPQMKPVKMPLLKDVAAAMVDRLDFDSKRAACKAMGWLPQNGKIGDFDFRGEMARRLKEHLSDVGKILTLCLIAPDLVIRPYDRHPEAKHLGPLAARAKVNLAAATRIMLHVHRNGVGVAGVYPREVAETRASQVEKLAREHEFPLRCTTEPE